MQLLPWIVAFALVGLLVTVLAAWWLTSARGRRSQDLPDEWALLPRSVFSYDERRVYRLLREALPHHVVLAKLPLVRFCQAIDAAARRDWFDLLGAANVTFAVCSPNGRVLAAIDLENGRPPSPRALRIKQATLAACRVRYLRCPVDRPPSIAELQWLVPSSAAAMRGPLASPPPGRRPAGATGDEGGASRDERATLWQDSISFDDSFFSHDSRQGVFGPSEFGPVPTDPPRTDGTSARAGDGPSGRSSASSPSSPTAGLRTEERADATDGRPA